MVILIPCEVCGLWQPVRQPTSDAREDWLEWLDGMLACLDHHLRTGTQMAAKLHPDTAHTLTLANLRHSAPFRPRKVAALRPHFLNISEGSAS